MLRRMIMAYARRVAAADEVDLTDLASLQTTLDQALATAVAGQRAAGASWARIGQGLGITRQTAQARFRHLDPPATVVERVAS